MPGPWTQTYTHPPPTPQPPLALRHGISRGRRRRWGLSERVARSFLRQLADGLQELRNHNVAARKRTPLLNTWLRTLHRGTSVMCCSCAMRNSFPRPRVCCSPRSATSASNLVADGRVAPPDHQNCRLRLCTVDDSGGGDLKQDAHYSPPVHGHLIFFRKQEFGKNFRSRIKIKIYRERISLDQSACCCIKAVIACDEDMQEESGGRGGGWKWWTATPAIRSQTYASQFRSSS